MRLQLCPRVRALDPRPSELANLQPFTEATRLPSEEIPGRTHELPSSDLPIEVIECPPWSDEAISILAAMGRPTQVIEGRPGGRTLTRLWSPSRFLEQCAERMNPGLAVDLGCGSGRDVVMLAARGWRVWGIDVLPEALERAADLDARYRQLDSSLNPAHRASESVRWIQWDLSDGLPHSEEPFDLVCFARFLDRDLLRRLPGALEAGASVVGETFTTLHRERHGKPSSDRFVLELGELPRLLEGMDVVEFEESWVEGRHTARIWAHNPS